MLSTQQKDLQRFISTNLQSVTSMLLKESIQQLAQQLQQLSTTVLDNRSLYKTLLQKQIKQLDARDDFQCRCLADALRRVRSDSDCYGVLLPNLIEYSNAMKQNVKPPALKALREAAFADGLQNLKKQLSLVKSEIRTKTVNSSTQNIDTEKQEKPKLKRLINDLQLALQIIQLDPTQSPKDVPLQFSRAIQERNRIIALNEHEVGLNEVVDLGGRSFIVTEDLTIKETQKPKPKRTHQLMCLTSKMDSITVGFLKSKRIMRSQVFNYKMKLLHCTELAKKKMSLQQMLDKKFINQQVTQVQCQLGIQMTKLSYQNAVIMLNKQQYDVKLQEFDELKEKKSIMIDKLRYKQLRPIDALQNKLIEISLLSKQRDLFLVVSLAQETSKLKELVYVKKNRYLKIVGSIFRNYQLAQQNFSNLLIHSAYVQTSTLNLKLQLSIEQLRNIKRQHYCILLQIRRKVAKFQLSRLM